MLRITRGDDKDIPVRFPFDLTGSTVYFTVKSDVTVEANDPTDTNAVIKAQEDAHDHPDADPQNGLTVITLSHTVTGAEIVVPGDYVYDIQLIDAGGKRRTAKKSNGDLPPCKITPESTQRPA